MKRSSALLGTLLVVCLAPALQSQIKEFVVPMDANQEVPPNPSPARGSATVTLNVGTGQVTVAGDFANLLGAAVAAHIHAPAPRGANAGVVLPLAATNATSGTVSGAGTLSAATVADVLNGRAYINIHSTMFGGGEIRGQIDDFFWKGGRQRPMYDFDQKKKPAWGVGGAFTWCGPVALANSICWYDEYVCPGLVPPNLKDPVTGKTDPVKLIEEIACNFLPNGKPDASGVSCADLETAAQRWVNQFKPKFFEVHAVPANDFRRICWELRRSQDVIVLVGFYVMDMNGRIVRDGGHFMTLAGCGTINGQNTFAFSDPYWDSHAVGATGGRSKGPNGDPRDPNGNPCNHMDTANYSHDAFPIVAGAGGCLGVSGYTTSLGAPFSRQNAAPPAQWTITTPGTYIDWVFAVSPRVSDVPDSGSPNAGVVVATGNAVPGNFMSFQNAPCTGIPAMWLGFPIPNCQVLPVPPPLACTPPSANLGLDLSMPNFVVAGPTLNLVVPGNFIGDFVVQGVCLNTTSGICFDLTIAKNVAVRP